MADRYWVGNGGSYEDTAHWSASSGGAGGASVPGFTDNAFFDANSFTLAGQTVTQGVNENVLTMSWAGVLHAPSIGWYGRDGNAVRINTRHDRGKSDIHDHAEYGI